MSNIKLQAPVWSRRRLYADLNCVPWFARMGFRQRVGHFTWALPIFEKKAEKARRKAIKEHGDFLGGLIVTKADADLRHLKKQREVVIADRAPLLDWQLHYLDGPGSPGYKTYLGSPRWKRTALRKKCSVGYYCEVQGCDAPADDAHHRHYNNIAFEENDDLVALCHAHHKAQHPGWY